MKATAPPADAAALPFADGSYDLVVADNSLMDVADMPAANREAARVLQPGGQFCICVRALEARTVRR